MAPAFTATGTQVAPGPLSRPVLSAAVLALVIVILLSLSVGAQTISLRDVLAAISANDDSAAHSTILTLRVPRTVAGLLAGAALGLCGALMQALTRKPLADSGILGVNAGAALAMVVAVGLLAVTS